jgi:hypothetical protein
MRAERDSGSRRRASGTRAERAQEGSGPRSEGPPRASEARPKGAQGASEARPKGAQGASEARPKGAQGASEARSEGAQGASEARSEAVGSRFTATGTTSAVRIRAWLRPPSTDSVTFWRPHPGDRKVFPIVSTGAAVERPSDQVSPLWIRGRRLSTDCGRRKDPQGVHEVVHRRPTGWGRLSPAIPSFSTPLSTVRQRDAPDHRVE